VCVRACVRVHEIVCVRAFHDFFVYHSLLTWYCVHLLLMQIFAYGMVCAATAIGVVLTLATYLRQAVSTTHTASEWLLLGMCCIT